MTKTSINLQDLRRRIYCVAKANPSKRFWGMFVHATKLETLREAYRLARVNDGAPGVDGVTFDRIEQSGLDAFLTDIQTELRNRSYRPMQARKVEIPKGNGKTRTLSIPTIRDRVVQGALKLILEPVFEADFKAGSFGYRPKRTTHQAITRVAEAIIRNHTTVIDIDLKDFFGSVRHHTLLKKIAERINDDEVMHLIKLILKSIAGSGIAQGSPLSPLLSNIYLNEVDKILEAAKQYTYKKDKYFHVEYARFADDLVVLIDGHPTWNKLQSQVATRLGQEFEKLGVEINREKTKIVDLRSGETFKFLGFQFYRKRTRQGKFAPHFTPAAKSREKVMNKLSQEFKHMKSWPVRLVIDTINPIVRGWVNYFRIGHSSACFGHLKDWLEKKVRRHLSKACKRKGAGWARWSKQLIYETLGLFNDYRVQYAEPKVALVRRAT
ncbi:MAG: group II intron reverse transcriptase/maturase [Candidatus Melainabacteria bacterium]|nr:group II intron reverse transcriptase/maturase [Candidatus Melainabacteria bacterium]